MASTIRGKILWLFVGTVSLAAFVIQYTHQHLFSTAAHSSRTAAAPQKCTEAETAEPSVLFVNCGGFF